MLDAAVHNTNGNEHVNEAAAFEGVYENDNLLKCNAIMTKFFILE